MVAVWCETQGTVCEPCGGTLTLPIMSMVIASYIPAEKFSRAVENPCQFLVGTRPCRLSVFGRRQHYGEAVDAATLIPHMLEAFMARDRGFKKGERVERTFTHSA